MDSIGFYIVDKFPINYNNIESYNRAGYKVIYKTPFWYYVNTSNHQLTGFADEMQTNEYIEDDYENHLHKSHFNIYVCNNYLYNF